MIYHVWQKWTKRKLTFIACLAFILLHTIDLKGHFFVSARNISHEATTWKKMDIWYKRGHTKVVILHIATSNILYNWCSRMKFRFCRYAFRCFRLTAHQQPYGLFMPFFCFTYLLIIAGLSKLSFPYSFVYQISFTRLYSTSGMIVRNFTVSYYQEVTSLWWRPDPVS